MTDKLLGYAGIAALIVMQTYCQLIIKWRVGIIGADLPPFSLMLKCLFDPWIISAFLAGLVGILSWTVAISRIELSIAYPIATIVIPLVAIAGIVLYGEPATLYKIVGIALVFGGVIFLGLG